MDEPFYIPPVTKTRVVAVDLDGTLARDTWKPNQIKSVVGKPIVENIEKLDWIKASGYTIMIYTSRHWSDRNMIEEWLKENKIPYDEVICGKPLWDWFVDDKNINSREAEWFPKW
jgi:hydroxymethylpyrimidine pyrophosphatase-like HAD family hydrolase